MRLGDLAKSLELAGEDVARMGSQLSAEGPFTTDGGSAAQELVALLNTAWSQRQAGLQLLATELADLSANVRLAAERYTVTDKSQEWPTYQSPPDH